MYQEQEINLETLEPKTSRQINRHKLKEGDNFFRILPPFGANHNGMVFAEWRIHWGYSDGNGQTRPLVCTFPTEGFCPICEESKKLYQAKEDLIKEFKNEDKEVMWKLVPEDIKAQHTELRESWNTISSKKSYYYNAIDPSGNVAILQLSKTAKDQLNEKILYAHKKMGFNPVSLQTGCFFNVKKVKTGPRAMDVKYIVDFVKETIKAENGDVMEKIKREPISSFVIENFDKLAYDLHTLYPIRTAEELYKIMNGDTSSLDSKKAFNKQDAAIAANSTPSAPVEAPKVEAPALPNVDSKPTIPAESQVGTKVANAAPEDAAINNLKSMLGFNEAKKE